ncbi:MAG: HNH endonuclease, partial [bacterium]
MNTIDLSRIGHLSNQEVIAGVKLFAQREREATAALVAHLAVLHLSESAAYSRIEAARAARKYPVILEMLSDGSVNLTTVGLLVPELTPENHVALLEAARHKSKRQVQGLVAQLRPQPSVPSCVRRLPTLRLAPQNSEPGALPAATLELSSAARAPLAPLRARKAVIAPLAPQQYKVQFTASAETHAKLLRIQELLRAQIPDGDVGEVIDRALTALLNELSKRKFAATDRPRKSGTNQPAGVDHSCDTDRPREPGGVTVARSRHIPAEVKRTVWKRDDGQCAFVAHNGRRCSERVFLEFHHVVPYSTGGEATVENIQLRCRAHNGHEAE